MQEETKWLSTLQRHSVANILGPSLLCRDGLRGHRAPQSQAPACQPPPPLKLPPIRRSPAGPDPFLYGPSRVPVAESDPVCTCVGANHRKLSVHTRPVHAPPRPQVPSTPLGARHGPVCPSQMLARELSDLPEGARSYPASEKVLVELHMSRLSGPECLTCHATAHHAAPTPAVPCQVPVVFTRPGPPRTPGFSPLIAKGNACRALDAIRPSTGPGY